MAKITINADTISDDLEVLVDGVAVVDVEAVAIYLRPAWDDPGEKELNINIQSCSENKESKVKTFTTLIAADTSEGKDLKGKGARQRGDFVLLKNVDKVRYDILECFGV